MTKTIIKENYMAKATVIKLRDQVYFMKRPDGTKKTVDNAGEWLAGAGKIIGIITKGGDRKMAATPVSDVAAVRILPYPDDSGNCDVIEAKVGEFTYSMENWLANLTA